MLVGAFNQEKVFLVFSLIWLWKLRRRFVASSSENIVENALLKWLQTVRDTNIDDESVAVTVTAWLSRRTDRRPRRRLQNCWHRTLVATPTPTCRDRQGGRRCVLIQRLKHSANRDSQVGRWRLLIQDLNIQNAGIQVQRIEVIGGNSDTCRDIIMCVPRHTPTIPTYTYLFYWGSMPPRFPSLHWHLKAALRDSCYWLGHPIVTTSCLRSSVTSVSSEKTAHFSHSLLTWSTLHNRAGSFHAKLIYYPNIHRHDDYCCLLTTRLYCAAFLLRISVQGPSSRSKLANKVIRGQKSLII